MERRQKDLYTMAEQAGLSPVRYERKSNRATLLCMAENGAERSFSVSMGSHSDVRGDLNELGAMKRFARENKPPEPPAAPATTTPATPKKATLTMPKPTTSNTPTTATTDQMPAVAFYRVCEWVKAQKLANFPTQEALALQAAVHVGMAVSDDDIKLVLSTIGTKEPAHWTEPTDPHAIIVRELTSFMKKLGEAPTPAFERLAARLLP